MPESWADELFDHAASLAERGFADDAIRSWDALVESFEGDASLDARVMVLRSLNAKADLLTKLDRLNDALAVRDMAIERFGDAEDASLHNRVGITLFRTAQLLRQLGRTDDGIGLLRDVSARFADVLPAREPNLAFLSLFYMAEWLYELGELDATIVACDEIRGRFGASASDRVQGMVAKAMWLKSLCLDAKGEPERELTVLTELVSLYSDRTPVGARTALANALYNAGAVLDDAGRPAEAIELWTEAFERFKDDPPQGDPLIADKALFATTESLGRQGRIDMAATKAAVLFARLATQSEPIARAQLGEWLVTVASTLADAGALEPALRVFTAVTDASRDAGDERGRTIAAESQIGRAHVLTRLGRPHDALQACEELAEMGEPAIVALDEILARGAEASSYQVAWAMFAKVSVMATLGRRDRALELVDEILDRFAHDASPITRAAMGMAREARRDLIDPHEGEGDV